MPLHKSLPESISEVDVIVAGGGTAGCVVAARLAEADPSLSILIIEGGGNNDRPTCTYPLLFLGNLMPETGTCNFITSKKSSYIADRELVIATGAVLGGGSSVNMMTYSRAQGSDLDAWNTEGWSAKDLLPFMKKLESYQGPGKEETHGSSGPMQISSGPFKSERMLEEFIAAAGQIGYPEAEDIFDLKTNNAMQRNLRYVSLDGKRQDAASRYIHPKMEDSRHSKLHVLLNFNVVRVLIENKKAVGVEIQRKSLPENTDALANQTIKARKMVVVSCGALGSPLVLERSGLGNPEVLKSTGVPVIADLPGIGNNYQDHQFLLYPYRSDLKPEETLDAFVGGRLDVGELIKINDPILGWNAQEVTSRIRPLDEEIAGFGAPFGEVWARKYKDFPDRPLAHFTVVAGFGEEPKLVPVGQYFSISTFSTYPESRGSLHITGPGVLDPVDFDHGIFNDETDIKAHVWIYKKQREIARRMASYRGEVALGHPPFPPHSAAACVEVNEPLNGVKDIVYSAEDDALIEQFVRGKVAPVWHSLGTCKMAPLDDGGVVNSSLGVHGIEALKVVDLSIVPVNVAANTNNMALTIGEKAADMFIRELSVV